MKSLLLPILLLLLPGLLDAFGATYPGSFYGVLLQMARPRERKLARAGPSPPRLWAYMDPADSDSDSVYHRATKDELSTLKRQRPSTAVYKPSRLRYNSRQEAREAEETQPPNSSVISTLPSAGKDPTYTQKVNGNYLFEPTSTDFKQFKPERNGDVRTASTHNSSLLQTPSTQETSATRGDAQKFTIDPTEDAVSSGSNKFGPSPDPEKVMHSSSVSRSPAALYRQNSSPKLTPAKTNATQKRWSSTGQGGSPLTSSAAKILPAKSQTRKFGSQNVESRRAYPTFHPLRPTMSPSDIRKRDEFYEKFAQQQQLLPQIGHPAQTGFEGDRKYPDEWLHNAIQREEESSQLHRPENLDSSNVNYREDNGDGHEGTMLENTFDHSEFLHTNAADDYDQFLYLQQLKNNQKHLIDNKNKAFPSLYAGEDDEQILSQANETSIFRRQNLDIAQSFINFNPLKLSVSSEGDENRVAAAEGAAASQSSKLEGWLKQKQQQTLEALQPDPLQQLVLQRQHIALQHLQRNVKRRDHIQKHIKPLHSAGVYRSSDGGSRRGSHNTAPASPHLPECGGEFTFELDPLNFARHPRERAFSRSFHTPGYGSGEPYLPGLTCLWSVQIGPSCRYGMLVYSLQPSFIRRSHACSQDHLDVVYNGDRVSRYCGPLSRQQRVSGAQIWSTSSPKNLTLLFESSPNRRRGTFDQKNWGVAIDVAAYCWGYSEAFKMQLNFLKKKMQTKSPVPTPATTARPVVELSPTSLPDEQLLSQSSYMSDFTDSKPSALDATFAQDHEPEAALNTLTASPPVEDCANSEGEDITSVPDLEESSLGNSTPTSTGSTEPASEDGLEQETEEYEIATTTENVNTQGENYPKISEAKITIVETAPQSSHGSSFPPKIYTVPIVNKIYHVPVRTSANNTPSPAVQIKVKPENDVAAATFVNVPTKFVNFSQDEQSKTNDALESLLTMVIDNSPSDENVTESPPAPMVTPENNDRTVPVKETQPKAHSRATKFDSTTMSSEEHKPQDNLDNNSTFEVTEKINNELKGNGENGNFFNGEANSTAADGVQNTDRPVLHEKEETVEPASFLHTTSAPNSVRDFTEVFTSPEHFTESNVNFDLELEATDAPSVIPETESDLDRKSPTLAEAESTASDAIGLPVTRTEALVISDPFTSQPTSTEKFAAETMQDENTERIESSTKHYAYLFGEEENETQGNESSTEANSDRIDAEKNETEKIPSFSDENSDSVTVERNKTENKQQYKGETDEVINLKYGLEDIRNEKVHELHNNALAAQMADDISMSVRDRNVKFHDVQVLENYTSTPSSVQRVEITRIPDIKTGVFISEVQHDKASKQDALQPKSNQDQTATVTDTSDMVVTEPSINKSSEDVNISKSSGVTDKRINRKDPDRLLRGTVQSRGATRQPLYSYQSHRFRKFPW